MSSKSSTAEERLLARIKVYRAIFFVIWDAAVPVLGVVVLIYVLLNRELWDPQFLSAIGTLFGASGILRAFVQKKKSEGDDEG